MGVHIIKEETSHTDVQALLNAGDSAFYPLGGQYFYQFFGQTEVPIGLTPQQITDIANSLKSGDNISELLNDADYQNETEVTALINSLSIEEAPNDAKQYSRESESWETASNLYDTSDVLSLEALGTGGFRLNQYGNSRTESETIQHTLGVNPTGQLVQQTVNSGQVKINGSGGSPITIVGVEADEAEICEYDNGALDLSSTPTTSWPKNISNPQDSDIVDPSTLRFLENPIPGQVHIWRIEYRFTNKGGNNNLGLLVGFRNPVSNFIVSTNETLPSGTAASPTIDFGGGTDLQVGNSITLITIADSASIGTGYELFVASTIEDNNFNFIVDSVTRISTPYIVR